MGIGTRGGIRTPKHLVLSQVGLPFSVTRAGEGESDCSADRSASLAWFRAYALPLRGSPRTRTGKRIVLSYPGMPIPVSDLQRRVEESNPYPYGYPGVQTRLQTVPRHPPESAPGSEVTSPPRSAALSGPAHLDS